MGNVHEDRHSGTETDGRPSTRCALPHGRHAGSPRVWATASCRSRGLTLTSRRPKSNALAEGHRDGSTATDRPAGFLTLLPLSNYLKSLRIRTENLVTTARMGRAQTAAATPTSSVTRELEMVEQRLGEAIRSREARLTEISQYLIGSGGKRIRPTVTLLAFRASGGQDEALSDIVDVAVALELIHSASLLHDDIIDGSAFRRGRDSALRKFGLAETLVAGDFLFGRAYDLCARFEEKLIQWAVQACISLTEGEIMQGRLRRNPAVTLADYLQVVERKTASLFEAGARTAAYLAGASADVVDTLARAGHHVGMTFQMIDDVLDVVGEEQILGKPVGIDLREGSPSLPIVLTIRQDEEVRRVFQTSQLKDEELEATLRRLRASPALLEARQLADRHAEHAQQALTKLPRSSYRESLVWLVEQLVERVR